MSVKKLVHKPRCWHKSKSGLKLTQIWYLIENYSISFYDILAKYRSVILIIAILWNFSVDLTLAQIGSNSALMKLTIWFLLCFFISFFSVFTFIFWGLFACVFFNFFHFCLFNLLVHWTFHKFVTSAWELENHQNQKIGHCDHIFSNWAMIFSGSNKNGLTALCWVLIFWNPSIG